MPAKSLQWLRACAQQFQKPYETSQHQKLGRLLEELLDEFDLPEKGNA